MIYLIILAVIACFIIALIISAILENTYLKQWNINEKDRLLNDQSHDIFKDK